MVQSDGLRLPILLGVSIICLLLFLVFYGQSVGSATWNLVALGVTNVILYVVVFALIVASIFMLARRR